MSKIIEKTVVSKNAPHDANVDWLDISGEKPIKKSCINGKWVSIGEVTDYNDVRNKPTINGVELDGNKTSQDLGVYSKPSSGIPQSDLSSDVQSQLNKHFKGWYTSSNALPANPVIGDYAYVKGAEATDPAVIYECTTTGSWSDSGRTADTSNVQTFASSQPLNEVHIVNDCTTGGVNNVLSAEQGKIITETYGKYENHPNWVQVITDVDDKLVEGIKTDGTKVLQGDLEVGGNTVFHGDVQFDGDIPPQIQQEIDTLNNCSVKSYFENEMIATIETILSHTKSSAVVLPILTDSHEQFTERSIEQTNETIANVKYLCNNCYCDGVVHLGDLLVASAYTTLRNQGKTEDEANTIITRLMSSYLNRYAAAHPDCNLFAVGGNHDGRKNQVFEYDRWYSIIGRRENSNSNIVKSGLEPYFYVDFAKCNLRCVFLQQPNNYANSGTTIDGYTVDMLEWLINDALDVTDGTHVVMFSHIAPMQASYIPDGVLQNLTSFYGVCNAFYNHTSYSDSNVSCDFSSLQTSKLLCYVCGHCHGDWIYAPGETFEGTAIVGGETVSWTYENEMPCSVVIITNTFVGVTGDGQTRNGDLGTYHNPRVDKTVTQDAWDTFLYNPTEKKIHFIRFGSGSDRVVDISNVI